MSEAAVLEQELGNEALTMYEKVLAVQVVDQPTYEVAGEMASGLKALEKKITEYFSPMKKAAHEAHKAVTKRETDELKPVQEAMAVLRQSMNAYLQEQERMRREAQRKAEEAARLAAEKERERLLAQAVKAEEKGKVARAEELFAKAEDAYIAPVIVPATVAQTVRTDTATLSQAQETTVEVVDLRAFLTEVVKRGIPPTTMIEVKVAPLKAWVKANALESFPGLRISTGPSVRIR